MSRNSENQRRAREIARNIDNAAIAVSNLIRKFSHVLDLLDGDVYSRVSGPLEYGGFLNRFSALLTADAEGATVETFTQAIERVIPTPIPKPLPVIETKTIDVTPVTTPESFSLLPA